ncbi:hypothetical protein EGK75_08350 [Neisseria weixii]|uniref:Uncharacterized protein n=1 Tax=Neisseria weixii TaxID=1853276 RepID=A0A3N4MR10_9NEIS|nr:hypothetical protein [Neisseria weixii]RPD86141.1 hypothetical protein EGK74_08605 [Neisseria weixii]RPD86874.1 hypothetical protein EGK75_08350 [Neisseria weixii]
MKKFFKWTAIFIAMFCIATLLSMVAGKDVSWAAFTDDTNWGVGVLFAPLLTAVCWALWPSPATRHKFFMPTFTGTPVSNQEAYTWEEQWDFVHNPAFAHRPGNIWFDTDDANKSNIFQWDDFFEEQEQNEHKVDDSLDLHLYDDPCNMWYSVNNE